ncbi:unnamed protein product [Notodromas monacha]|uniref:Poly(A) polymerase nucleotidyltransferase domain-containing protein n=1 Tax=Notodromas monacha TaxID=399045 RepID=A0A7R9BZN0_9CRUS|nr:unnamed protein product [Notodromas monacha]CAG0923269.1 unnamed protein product [Notodromas monacha]
MGKNAVERVLIELFYPHLNFGQVSFGISSFRVDILSRDKRSRQGMGERFGEAAEVAGLANKLVWWKRVSVRLFQAWHSHPGGGYIDAQCVSPRHVERSDFFTSFVDFLRATSGVSDIRPIENAYDVPVLKLKLDGIELDFVFTKLPIAA